ILKKGWTGIGIIGINNAAKPTEMLDIRENPDDNADYEDLHKVKIRDLPRTDGDPENDKIVTVDESNGILRSVSKADLLSDIGGTGGEGPWLTQSDGLPTTEN